jgi:hypothetical protein
MISFTISKFRLAKSPAELTRAARFSVRRAADKSA